MVTRHRAVAPRTSPTSHRRVSTACEPHAPTHPPPRARSKSQPYSRAAATKHRAGVGPLHVLDGSDGAALHELVNAFARGVMAELEVHSVHDLARVRELEHRRLLRRRSRRTACRTARDARRRSPPARARRAGTAANGRTRGRGPGGTTRRPRLVVARVTTSTTSQPSVAENTGATTRAPKPVPMTPTRTALVIRPPPRARGPPERSADGGVRGRNDRGGRC